MRSLAALTAEEACRLRGVVFDLDGTVLTGGRLTLEAYKALFLLKESGLELVACTGRPSGWGSVVARQWPVDLTVVENGAIAFQRVDGTLRLLDSLDQAARRERWQKLCRIRDALCEKFPTIPLADDQADRRTDVSFDVREGASISVEVVRAFRRAAERLGARTIESSIHVHVTLEPDDKASGTVRALAQVFGEDPTRARSTYAFVGDSANDGPCFSAFATTLGVANVANWLSQLSVPPRFVSTAAEGAGFAEIAERISELRRCPP